MNPMHHIPQLDTRRQFLAKGALGLGTAALSALLSDDARGNNAPSPEGLPGVPHFAPTAKRAIYLFMAGAPSQIDTFDYKPALDDRFNSDLPESIRKGQRLTTMTSRQKSFPIAPSAFRFKRYDNEDQGAWISEILPYTASMAKDIAIIRSVHTDAINHDPAITCICTGRELPGWPSLGSWLSYGLGSMNQDLPTFVVLNSSWTGRKTAQALYNRLWGSGMLPSKHGGVAFRSKGDPVLFLDNPPGVDPQTRRRMLDALNALNGEQLRRNADPQTEARIAQYEMAFRMQTSVPEVVDLSGEPQGIVDSYGPDARKAGSFASNCLLSRRLLERGVRFVQIFHRGWDQHERLPHDIKNQCRDIDQPAWALIQDLKRRGMLEDTLVVWGGEFGRTAYCQGKLTRKNYGRDHHPRCFSVWMAGGGIKPGIVHGKTDEFSYNIIENPVQIRDLNATILHTLGIDDRLLSIKHQGLDVRLTGTVKSHVVHDLLL